MLGAELRPNMDWVSPLGVPYPPVGITNTHWQYHPDVNPSATFNYGSGAVSYRTNSHGPYVYYVDNSHPSATDSGNTYGTTTTPRLTFPWPVASASVIQVAGPGHYTFNNSSGVMVWGGQATSASDMIFYKGVGASTNVADLPKIDGKASHLHGKWFGIENFVMTNDTTLATRNSLFATGPTTNIVVRDNFFYGRGIDSTSVSVANSSGSSTLWTENLVVLKNYFSSYGDYQLGAENDACSTIFREYATNCFFLDNFSTLNGGDTIRVGANEDNELDNAFNARLFVSRNTMTRNGENAIDVKKAHLVVISENVLYDFHQYVGASGGETIITVHYNPNYTWILNNRISDGLFAFQTGSRMQNTNQLWIVGNVMHTFTDSAIYFRGVFTNYIYNNVIADAPIGYRTSTSGTGVSWNLRNNVVLDTTTSALQMQNSSSRNKSTVQYDAYVGVDGTPDIQWSSTYSSVAAWDTAIASVSSVLSPSDPGFVDSSSNDYRLTENSVLRAAGVDVKTSMEAAFLSQFGYALNYTSLSGVNPAADGSFDVGAYEYVAEFIPSGQVTRGVLSGGASIH